MNRTQQVYQRSWSAKYLGILLGAGWLTACGDSSATLTIQLQALPDLTSDQVVTVQGTVTRSPTKETITVVTIAGGVQTVRDSLASPGSFSLNVTLVANSETQLAVTASDAEGNVSQPVIATILHDDIGPQITQMSPASRSENVALDAPIEVEFGERLIAQPGAAIRLLHNGSEVAGTVTVSADSQRVSFAPASILEPASVYQLTFSGFTDGTGNPVTVDTQACFLTEIGNLVTQVDRDSADGSWVQGNPESNLTRTDVSRIRYARVDSTMYTLVEFTNERSYSDESNNNTLMYFEIDADQDPQTGFTSVKDTIFTPFPELESGIGVDFIIFLERIPEVAEDAHIGIMTEPLTWDILEGFNVGICGRFWGFQQSTFLSTNGDDGIFDYTAIAFTIGNDGNLIDVVPESGFNTANIIAVGPPVTSDRDKLFRWRGVHGLEGLLDRLMLPPRRGATR